MGSSIGGCEVRWINPKLSQRRGSPDAGRKNFKSHGRGQIVQSRNYSTHLSGWHLLMKENTPQQKLKKKKNPTKITMTQNQDICPSCFALRSGKPGACSAEVGALAPSVRKISSNSNPIQTYSDATFNVWTLNRIGPLHELTTSAAEHNIDIV